MKKRNNKTSKELLKINLFVTTLIVIINLIIFYFIDSSKDKFTILSTYANIFLLFIYLFLFSSKTKKNMLELKKEALYINYPLCISLFFLFFLIIIVASTICLISVNKEAANITFIFTFFMSTVSMLFPSIVLIVYMFFAVPALIIPSLDIQKRERPELNILLIVLFAIFLLFCIYNGINTYIKQLNFEQQNKYRSARLTVSYSTDFLKISNDINSYSQKKMSINTAEVPFDYTAEPVPYDNFESAKIFCNALDARMPNYLETYFIVFNKFDTFGEKYYWINHKDGRHDLVLHYKNMSYEIIRRPANVKPLLYCVAKSNDNYGLQNKKYFYRNIQLENTQTIKTLVDKKFNIETLKNVVGLDKKEQINTPKEEFTDIPTIKEKKHVSFSVKEVSNEVFYELIKKGYHYDPNITIKKEYETNDFAFTAAIRKNTNNIRLCAFPFTEYDNLSLYQEQQIWQQSFCSPAFDLVDTTPVLKSKYEKDAYCYANGGRLPNIPELNGILKTLGNAKPNVGYWTNNKITDSTTNTQIPVFVYYKDSRFLKIKPVTQYENDNAYVYCIKKPKQSSRVISNYKSRFPNIEGYYYAKEKCPSCHYYEVPDVILQQ